MSACSVGGALRARAATWLAGSILILALLSAGCGHTEAHHALFRLAEPRASGAPVEIYMADQPLPQRPLSEIALVQAIGFGTDAHPESVARALTDRAAQLGCDAVLRTVFDQGYARVHAVGVCVRWLGPGAPAPAAALPKDTSGEAPPAVSPAPMPRIEALPSGPPSQGGGR